MPVSELDIWHSAEVILNSHEDKAEAHAMARAAELEGQGDERGAEMWRRIRAAIVHLQAITPRRRG